ncbi:hypothetical protein RT97_31120 [Variovorax paradoxus]|uniref:DUF3606 domain-containing protein n=1 Tax=Variovorax paradoxus TaxID=34073 RepID=A0A0D0KI97_VARPD|nr:DUF3606 domain-containing protein [Variovorax paradoxus]KIQ16313.1 hypothetical protein RT97_31120 [Variovorax paradoxus]
MTRSIRPDAKSISTPTPAAAKAWADHLGCSVAELRIAVRAVGNSVERVQAYLEALKRRDSAAPDDHTPAAASAGSLGQPSNGHAAAP